MMNTKILSGESKKKNRVEPKAEPVTKRNYIGRNAQCPCGSGKKYKKCCLIKRTYTPKCL